jgi:hypothetical protein
MVHIAGGRAIRSTSHRGDCLRGAGALLPIAKHCARTRIALNTSPRGRDIATLAVTSRGTGWFLVTIVPSLLVWWAIGRGDDWVTCHQREINAWLIARFGRADISQLLQAEVRASRWIRWAVLPVLSLSLLSALLTRQVRRSQWWRRACHWRTLVVATTVFLLLFALPGS